LQLARDIHLFFSTPINFVPVPVPVHMYAASDAIFTSPEQLMNKRLCFPFSYSLDSLEQGIVDKFQMKINRVKDGIGCVKHVQKGWSDAGLTNGYIRANKLPKNEGDDISIVIFPEQLALIPLYLVIGKDYPNAKKWLAEFDYAYTLLQLSGEKAAEDQRYLDLINAP
jgi:polar amino acid transport system substrate-binding protein